jgi:Flp pilus assembly protein TadG
MSRPIALLRRFLLAFGHDTSGTSAAEFALVVPFFILTVFGTINTCLALSAVNSMHFAAERTARCLAVGGSTSCSSNVDTYAKGWYRGPGLNGLNFTGSTDPTCGKLVTGNANFNIITGLNSTAVTINAKACYPLI